LLQQRCPAATLRVVPNGVDLEAFHPLAAGAVPERLIFVGHLGVPHNIDAALYLAREILPLVAAQAPDCALQLVGAEPDRSLLALNSDPRIEVPGYVPDLNAALNQAQVFVAPLRFAAGVQNKVLEAMAAGRPVVTTPLVNQGLGATAGQDLLTADDPQGLAEQILSLLQNPELARRIGGAGRRFVEAHFSWDAVVQRAADIEASLGKSTSAF
jgi:glycosyltransferase involved in cell wall biosynthesis